MRVVIHEHLKQPDSDIAQCYHRLDEYVDGLGKPGGSACECIIVMMAMHRHGLNYFVDFQGCSVMELVVAMKTLDAVRFNALMTD